MTCLDTRHTLALYNEILSLLKFDLFPGYRKLIDFTKSPFVRGFAFLHVEVNFHMTVGRG